MAAEVSQKNTILFRTWGPFVLLCLVTFICYANSLQNGFVADDHYIIQLDRQTLSFKTALDSLTGADRLFENDDHPYYRPLTRFSFLLDKYFFGTNPAGFHAVNVALHICCTLLVYVTLLRLGHRRSVSLCAALLFGIHPINSEAVNFISTRNTVLATVFTMLSLLAFLDAERTSSRRMYFLSALLFFFGLLSKEIAAMLLPFFVILKTRDAVQKRGWMTIAKWDLTYLFYHVLFLAGYLGLRYVAVGNDYIQTHLSSLGSRIMQLFYAIPAYFSLLVFPSKLSFTHTVPHQMSGHAVFLIGVWIMISIAVIAAWKHSNHALFWLLWLGINFLPVSTIIPIPSASLAERYLYLPVIAIFALFAETVSRYADRFGVQKLAAVSLACVLLALGLRTHQRNADWKNDLTLALSSVKADPRSASNRFFLGLHLYEEGRTIEALREFSDALALDPHAPQASWAYYYLGTINIEAGRTEEGKRFFTQSVNAGNHAADYFLQVLLSDEGPDSRKKTSDMPLPMTKIAFPFVPDVNDRMRRPGTRSEVIKGMGQEKRRTDASSDDKGWTLVHRYSSGTELYFAADDVRTQDSKVIIKTRQVLSPSDQRSFAFRIIRFPAVRAAEISYDFLVNCRQMLYIVTAMQFRDAEGMVLGTIYPEKEEYVFEEYLYPGLPMRSLADQLCRSREF